MIEKIDDLCCRSGLAEPRENLRDAVIMRGGA
jgi:hypothetical protein